MKNEFDVMGAPAGARRSGSGGERKKEGADVQISPRGGSGTERASSDVDRNGYAPSIMQKGRESLLGGISGPDRCYCCGRGGSNDFLGRLERHEPWNAANRTKSKSLGLWIMICRGCHEEAHRNREMAEELRRDAQRAAMLRYGWSREEWIKRFGKSELNEGEAAHIIPKEAGGDQFKKYRPAARRQRARDGEEEPRSAGAFPPSAGMRPTERATTRQGAGGFRVVLDGPELPY